jgi:PadR family transcriptional regulator PadR
MTDPVRVTAAVSKVLAALLEDPEADRYGLDLMRASGHPSGTLYPILLRLQKAGWVDATWEEIDPAAAGRPARRYYRLTPDGLASARIELAALRQQLDRALGSTGVAQPGTGLA